MFEYRKFSNHPAAAATIAEDRDSGAVRLYSYNTLVSEIRPDPENGNLQIIVNGLYSRTTIKHLGWFMREFGCGHNYYFAKAAIGKGYIDL